jgi:hypothetical protein
MCVCVCVKSRGSVVVTVTGHELNAGGVPVPVGSRIFNSPYHPDWFYGAPSVLSIGYRRSFSKGQSARGVKLTTLQQLVPRSSKRGNYISIPPYVFLV